MNGGGYRQKRMSTPMPVPPPPPALKRETTEAVEPKKQKENPWNVHVRQFRTEHPEYSFKECLQKAKETYTKKS